MKQLRQIITVMLGHVDHGKSSILDAIRESCIVAKEAGAITQAIGASIVPSSVIEKKCGSLLEKMNMKLTVPGLLFIDTPGHAAFTSLRKRGGNLADIAVLVVDINEGFKPQTIEALEILKSYKTPFIVAANKIDLVPGWRTKDCPILGAIQKQEPNVVTMVETKLYELVGKLSEHGVNSERFDRVSDFTKEVGIVPVSAKTQEGLPELMMMLAALAQKYLEAGLHVDTEGCAKGTILEVKEEKGLGVTMDVILYDGELAVNDQIVIGAMGKPIVTKVRALFEPMPLAEMRDTKSKFKPVKNVVAAIGVKIAAPDIKGVVAGMPLREAKADELDTVVEEIQAEVEDVMISTESDGIIIKADTIGSLEAMVNLLKAKDIPIRKATVGDISKKDVSDANTNFEKDPLTAVILGFNVSATDEVIASGKNVKIITSDIIYTLIDAFEKWQKETQNKIEAAKLEKLASPCKLKIMPNCVFRQSNPAIVGVDVLQGKLKNGVSLMNSSGVQVGHVKAMQSEKKNINEAESGKQVAASILGPTVGRQIQEEDELVTYIPEPDFRRLKDSKEYLTSEQKEVLRQIAEIMRRENPVWGV